MTLDALQRRPIMPAEWRDHVILTVLGVALVGALIGLMLPLKYPYANDTTGYVQEAQNLLHGEGLVRGTGWTDTKAESAATPLFPPGFALEIAGLSYMGLNLPHAALAASWLAWLLLLPAIAYAVRPLVGRWAAMVVSVMAVSSPGFVEWGYQALSDSGMALFSVLSLGVLARHDCSQRGKWGAVMLSGLLAGVAYLLRNAGAIVPVTVTAFFGLSVLTRQLEWRSTLRSGLLWAAGFAVLAFPLFFYNLHMFGRIQPYIAAHGATDVSVLSALRLSLWSLLLDLTAWRTVAEIAWSGVALGLLVLPTGILLSWAGWLRWQRSLQTERSALLLFLLYASLGFAMIVWGRSRFDWVEVTLTRQLMPYSWAVLAAVTWILWPSELAANNSAGRGPAAALVLVGLLMMLAGRFDSIRTDHQREAKIQDAIDKYGYAATAAKFPDAILTNRIKQNTSRDRVLIALLKALPDNAHIVSNHGPLLGLETGRHVRSFDPTQTNLATLAALRPLLGNRALILVMIPTNTVLRSAEADTWQEDTLRRIGTKFKILLRTPTALVVDLL